MSDWVGEAAPDPDELVRWTVLYGHPEGWAKKAQQLQAEVERLREALAHERRMLTVLREGDGHMIREATEMLREELDEMPPEVAGIRSAWLDKLMLERDMLRANIDRLERALSDSPPSDITERDR